MICLAFTAYLAVKGKISVGEVVLYQTYFTSLVGQISTLINIYPQISKGLESVKSIGDIMGNSHVEENNSIVPLGELKGAVKFVNVDFKYPDSDKNTLSDFTLDVKPGESIALVGESGEMCIRDRTYSTNKDHPIKILCSFYKGKQKKLVETGFFLILQRSPIWIIPIATSNIINAATNPDAGSLEIILLNVMVALLFICLLYTSG